MRATKSIVQELRSRTLSMQWPSEGRVPLDPMRGCLCPFGRQKKQAQQLQQDRLAANQSVQKPQWPRRQQKLDFFSCSMTRLKASFELKKLDSKMS